jgi:cellulose synthase operon protein C
MKLRQVFVLFLGLTVTACATQNNNGRISELDNVHIAIKDVNVKDGLDKAMQSYQKFLKETPKSQLTPEAMRRVADLKLEKEYGTDTSAGSSAGGAQEVASSSASTGADKPAPAHVAGNIMAKGKSRKQRTRIDAIADFRESDKAFEKRATRAEHIPSSRVNAKLANHSGQIGSDLQNANAEQAIALYNKLLAKYPNYDNNDQVLYQLSRAYAEIGEIKKSMAVMNRLVKQYPQSRYIDEVQFRRGEYFFVHKKYLDAEDAYGAVLAFGVGSVYYSDALFKKGWTFYKEQMYENALDEFFKLLDYKVSIGYDFDQTSNEIEKKRTDDTFRVISLAFSNLGGAQSVQDYFKKLGRRSYEDGVYSHLAEFYFGKRRYHDAASTYNAFIKRNPYNKKSPIFSMRVIEIYKKGGFPNLVIKAKKQYASTYGVHAEFWNHFNKSDFPQVLDNVKTNIVDLAEYYHSLYQNRKFRKDREKNFAEATRWYREFLSSFPKDKQAPAINYSLADLLLENKNYNLAAKEFERTAYDYPRNAKSGKAAYAAVYAYREYLKQVPEIQQSAVKHDIIRSSIRLVNNFPHHKMATVVLGSAVNDLYEMHEYGEAVTYGRRLINEYPNAKHPILRGAWLVVAHSLFALKSYPKAEKAYTQVLAMTAADDKSRPGLVDDLAASIYEQGVEAKKKKDYKNAVRNFLRIAKVAPTSKFCPTAEYDAAAVLIQTMDLQRAVNVLLAFRKNYPGNKLQHDVTKKLAYAYKEMGHYGQAGREFERVAAEAKDEEIIREAMLSAAKMYTKAKDTDNSLRVYKQFVARFPKPLEFALDTYYKIAMLYKTRNDLFHYHETLQHIITADAHAGAERTDRTRYLAAEASLVIIEPDYDKYAAIKLDNPLKVSMRRKQAAMKRLISRYSNLVNYHVADVTAAATYYLAEIYYNFSRALLTSEVPKGLTKLQMEEFKLQLEDQADPFETKAISIHEKNVQLLTRGVYSPWIDRSIAKLAKLVPARFDKPESVPPYILNISKYRYTPPAYIREESRPIYVENLQIFRYPSQKSGTSQMDQAQTTEKTDPKTGNAGGSPAPGNGATGPAAQGGAARTSASGQSPLLGPADAAGNAAQGSGTQPVMSTSGTSASDKAQSIPVKSPPAGDSQDDKGGSDKESQTKPSGATASATAKGATEPAAQGGAARTPAGGQSPLLGPPDTAGDAAQGSGTQPTAATSGSGASNTAQSVTATSSPAGNGQDVKGGSDKDAQTTTPAASAGGKAQDKPLSTGDGKDVSSGDGDSVVTQPATANQASNGSKDTGQEQ